MYVPGRRRRWCPSSHGGGPGRRRRPQPAAGIVHRPPRAAMRLLHPGLPDDVNRTAGVARPSRTGRHRRASRGEHLPLHRLCPDHRRRRRGGRRSPPWIGPPMTIDLPRHELRSKHADQHLTVGRSVRRRDLVEKVLGTAQYAVDITMPGMLHAKIVRADRAHARILAIESDKALALPDVVAVVTADQLAPLFSRFGHIIPDHFILATEKVRYFGEPVAVVLAETRAAAADAVDLVEVSYDDLPSVVSAAQALADNAPLVHETTYTATADASFKELTESEEGAVESDLTNVAHEVTIGWGDVDTAFAAAHLVVEGATRYPMLYAYAMEPYNAVAMYGDEGLTVVTTAQHPYMVRDDLARIFSLPLARVRVSAPYLGGGYGSKSYTKVEPLASVASWVAGRPVKLVLSVEEAIYTTRVDTAEIHVRSSFDENGAILAREFDIVMDSGAYADNSPLVLAKCVNRCFGPYRVPNLRVRGRSIYTNTSPASSYRGFGAPQGNLAGETNLDQAADRLGLDGTEIRRRNLVRHGEPILPGKRGIDADLLADLEIASASLERDRKDVPHYGMGVSCSASDAGAYPISTAQVRIQIDGSVLVTSGSTEMGQGSRSLLAQVAAEELGVDLGVVTVILSDTSVTAYE